MSWFHAVTDWMDRPAILARATAAVWVLAIGFRLVLALLNLEANDNHMAVSQVIAFEHRIPAATELHQSYHPKLFHGTVALLWRALPDQSLAAATHAAQLLNSMAGILTILAGYWFLRRFNLSPRTRLFSFALLALNPRLIAINVQASNDSFVILFAALTLCFGYEFFVDWRWPVFLGMLASATMATLSKSSGVILCVAVMGAFGMAWLKAQALAPVGRRMVVVYGATFLSVYLVTIGAIGPYWQYYRQYGTPLISNHATPPFPHFWKQTYYGRPGVTSIAHTLLTFRLVDLVRQPMSSQVKETYPLHRTSLWSHVYGSAHFAHFDNHPPSWRTRSATVQWIGRLILLLALFPTTVLLVGVVQGAIRFGQQWFTGVSWRDALGEAFLLLTTVGYVAALCYYALRQRSFTSMKAIYLFPALFGMVATFARTYEVLASRLREKPRYRLLGDAALAALIFLYAADIMTLIYQLR